MGVREAMAGWQPPIGMADSLIAGISVRHRAILLTRNRAHFQGTPGLTLSVGSE